MLKIIDICRISSVSKLTVACARIHVKSKNETAVQQITCENVKRGLPEAIFDDDA